MFAGLLFLLLIRASLSINFKPLQESSTDVDLAKQIDNNYLTATPELKFITSLETKTVSAGTKITLECQVRSKPSASILWFFNGELIQGKMTVNLAEKLLNTGKPIVDSVILSSIYEIPCPSSEHSGTYTCTASNLHQTISSTTDIKIDDSRVTCDETQKRIPRIFEWTDFQMENDHNSATLNCRAENAEQLIWTFKGKTIIDNKKHQLLSDGSLLIKDISFSHDMGEYTCTASNQYGKDSKEAVLYPSKKTHQHHQ